MTYQYSIAVKNAQLASLAQAVAGGLCVIYSGAEPANCAASPTGVILSAIRLPSSPFAAPSAGSMAQAGTWQDLNAAGGGNAGYFRLVDTFGICQAQGSIGLSAADMIIDKLDIESGAIVTITGYTVNAGN